MLPVQVVHAIYGSLATPPNAKRHVGRVGPAAPRRCLPFSSRSNFPIYALAVLHRFSPSQPCHIMNPSSKGTVVYSLVDAATLLSRGHERKSDSPIDVLGVVSDHFDVPRVAAKQCLRVVDPSGSAFVTIKMVDRQSIPKVGDMIRFNRVGLKRDLREVVGSATTAVDNTTAMTDNLPHFCHHWHDPDAGPDWICLGHVSQVDGSVVLRRPAHWIPESMVPDQAQISRLMAWYLHSDEFKARSPHLSQLPHRRRTIEEMLSCVGSCGEIVARVVQVVEPSSIKKTFTSSRKRPRGTVPMGFAILSDAKSSSGCRHLATLLDPEKRFIAKLRDANDSGRMVRICNLFSKKANQLEMRPDTVSIEDIVLLLTKDSRLRLLSDEECDDYEERYGNDEELRTTTPFSLTGTQASSVLPQLFKVQAHMVAIRKDESNGMSSLQPMRSRNCGSTMTVDTVFDLLLRHNSRHTGAMMWFRLELSGIDLGEMNVKASHLILQQFLGGDDIFCALRDGQDSSNNMDLGKKAMALLESLLEHGTPLFWDLKREEDDDEWVVTNVALHELM